MPSTTWPGPTGRPARATWARAAAGTTGSISSAGPRPASPAASSPGPTRPAATGPARTSTDLQQHPHDRRRRSPAVTRWRSSAHWSSRTSSATSVCSPTTGAPSPPRRRGAHRQRPAPPPTPAPRHALDPRPGRSLSLAARPDLIPPQQVPDGEGPVSARDPGGNRGHRSGTALAGSGRGHCCDVLIPAGLRHFPLGAAAGCRLPRPAVAQRRHRERGRDGECEETVANAVACLRCAIDLSLSPVVILRWTHAGAREG